MVANSDIYPDYCSKPALVLGCGNILFGDDGFGPSVIDYFNATGKTPENACFLNTGTSSRKILFDVTLSEKKPRKIIIVDAMDCGIKPGDVREQSLDCIPYNKIDDFSIHQVPTSNLLKELRDLCGVEVVLVVLQPPDIPSEVKPGLSRGAQQAVKKAADLVLALLRDVE